MSIEINVLFRGKLPDKKALSQAMAELGFPLTIKAGSLERQRGFMPMRLQREETGVEFDVFDGRAAVEDVVACFDGLEGTDLDPRFERSANFRWGGDEDQMLAGVCAAAALAKLVNGVVLGEWEAKLLSPEEAIALARETLQATLKPESTPTARNPSGRHQAIPEAPAEATQRSRGDRPDGAHPAGSSLSARRIPRSDKRQVHVQDLALFQAALESGLAP